MDGGWTPLPTPPRQYCNPSLLVLYHSCLNASLAFSIAVPVYLHAYYPCALKKNLQVGEELHGERRNKRWLVDKDLTCTLSCLCSAMIVVISNCTCIIGKLPISTEKKYRGMIYTTKAGVSGIIGCQRNAGKIFPF